MVVSATAFSCSLRGGRKREREDNWSQVTVGNRYLTFIYVGGVPGGEGAYCSQLDREATLEFRLPSSEGIEHTVCQLSGVEKDPSTGLSFLAEPESDGFTP